MKAIKIHDKYGIMAGRILVDNIDYTNLSLYKWHFDKNKYAWRNVLSSDGERKKIYMHREIMGNPFGKQVDHINHNKQDNRRKNLRICTHSENQFNRLPAKHNKSGIKGVSWDRIGKVWRVKISANNNIINIGRFKRKIDAIKSRKLYAKKIHKEFACE